jgi:hypothetical protein
MIDPQNCRQLTAAAWSPVRYVGGTDVFHRSAVQIPRPGKDCSIQLLLHTNIGSAAQHGSGIIGAAQPAS